MSGDVQARQRRKDKKKAKRDDITVPGVDTSKFNESDKKASVQMHVPDNDHDHHGAGMCAKIVFFSLMAILLGLVVLIVLENRGGSDVDTPLSESRFSEYLQGWVDEKREEDHHDEVHFHNPEDHDHDDDGDDDHADTHNESPSVPEDEPYPEEKDTSNDDEESQELNAEINVNDQDEDQPASQENDDDNNNDDDDDEEEENKSQPQEDEEEGNNIFEDSTPFEEEKAIKGDDIKKQVDELYDTYNEIAEMLGKERLDTKNIIKREAKTDESLKDDNDDDVNESENVIDNDDGEDLLLQKLAEESEIAQQQKQESSGDADDDGEGGSSSLLTKLGVGILLCIVAHQIIIKKISATKKIQEEEEALAAQIIRTNDDILNKRRYTMLSNSEEQIMNEDVDNEEIIEVMMVSGHNLNASQISHDDLEEVEYSDEEIEEEEEEYSDDEIDEFRIELHNPDTPQTFEDFQNMYRSEIKEEITESTNEPKFIEEETNVPESSAKAPLESSHEQEEDIDFDEEIEEEMEDEEFSGEELIDEDEVDYEEEESEEISDIDDSDLLKRLDEKYGKISDKSSEDNDWTKIPSEEGGAQSYMEELLRQQTLEENSTLRELYKRAKSLDEQAEKERSNVRLLEAIQSYKELIENHGDILNDTIFIEIAERCIERMRFIGKMKQAVDLHYKLIHRFVDEPSYQNQLAVTYLLANRLSAAKLVLHEVLSRWRYNGFALVHYGFILKNLDQDYEQAVIYLREGIDTNEEGTQDGRFYFNLGDALQRLGRNEEAKDVYKKGAELGLFPSQYQRSLYNVDRLKSHPFWTKAETTYKDDFMEIYKYWQIIRDEGLKLLSTEGYFKDEQENLKDTGDWKQFELFARGMKTKNCHLAPMTCRLLSNFHAASSCKRGQIKFSVLHPNTHVHSHCGPTNTRIRAHLGLKVPENTFIRVAEETRSWKEGEWLIFDDSFEHEVWHNGTSLRLVLIVDVWHPDLTENEKSTLSPI